MEAVHTRVESTGGTLPLTASPVLRSHILRNHACTPRFLSVISQNFSFCGPVPLPVHAASVICGSSCARHERYGGGFRRALRMLAACPPHAAGAFALWPTARNNSLRPQGSDAAGRTYVLSVVYCALFEPSPNVIPVTQVSQS